MPKILSLFCFAVSDKDDDDEGVPAFLGADGAVMPLLGADIARIHSLMPIAQQIANERNVSLRIYSFTGKRQIGEVNPDPERRRYWPDRCSSCNAHLMGGATNHSKECEIRKMIESVLKEVNE